MENLDNIPESIEAENWSIEERRYKLYEIASKVISKFVDLSIFSTQENADQAGESLDHVHEYAK